MAEENASPISAAKPPVVNPIKPVAPEHASTLKLKPVIRKPVVGGAKPTGLKLPSAAPAAPSAPAPAVAPVSSTHTATEQLKNITQKLKGVTQQIPQQAILHKTGIIADQDLTEAQKQASKSRTARISLSDALGVAPVKNEAAPMKTIRIKRPVDVQNPSSSRLAPAPAPAPAAAPAPAPAPAAAAPEAPEPSITQRKTLKIARPGAARPTKFGVKKPGAPASAAPQDGSGEVGDVADIPDMPAGAPQPPFAAADVCPPDRIPDVGKTAQVLGLVTQIAACGAVGFLVWRLLTVAQLPLFMGGLGLEF